ncbi:DMT family transporter [Desulfonatronum parangueonense]
MQTYLKLLCTSMFWGGTFVAGRLVSRELPPFSAAFLRFAIASVCLVILVRIYEGGLPRPRAAQILPIIVLGLSGIFAYNVLFFIGLQSVEAGRAAVIVATNPIFVALLAALLFKEPLGSGRLIGIGLSISGAVLAITGGHPLALFSQVLSWGDLAIFGCVASWVTYLLVGKVMMQNLSPHAAVTCSCLVGTAMLLPFSLAEGLIGHLLQISWTLWAALLYLGMFGTVLGFTWFYQAVKEIGPSRAAVFINFVPIWAIVSGFLILGESLNLTLILGAAMVGGGVYLTNRTIKTPGAEIPPKT